jgi:hypothetical protein
MDHSCPHCKKDLHWKMISIRPLAGVILDPKPYGANRYCPLCGGALKFNKHKYERKLILAPAVVAMFLGVSANQLHSKWLGLVGIVVMIISILVYVGLIRKIPATWKRYIPFQP